MLECGPINERSVKVHAPLRINGGGFAGRMAVVSPWKNDLLYWHGDG